LNTPSPQSKRPKGAGRLPGISRLLPTTSPEKPGVFREGRGYHSVIDESRS